MDKDLKFKIISEGLEKGVSVTCRKHNISRTLYYRWLKSYQSYGLDGLDNTKKNFVPVNKTDCDTEKALLELIRKYPSYGPKSIKYLFDELGYNISESAIFNIMKRNNLTQKKNRLKLSSKKEEAITSPIPTIKDLHSGECWIFWITPCGNFKSLGNIYIYSIYDVKSRIACSRLYNSVSFENFEDLLTSTAIPVSKTFNLKLNYLCILKDSKLLTQGKNIFYKNVKKMLSDNGFCFKIHTLTPSDEDFKLLTTMIADYSKGCVSFITSIINDSDSFLTLKYSLQDYIRKYNTTIKIKFDDGDYTPVEYHNKLTDSKLIFPIWAYKNRDY